MTREHTFIIAEAGVNHNGNVETAKHMIDAAADAGVDAVKFQSFKADRLVSPTAKKAAYQERSSDGGQTQGEMLRRLELDERAHRELFAFAARRGCVALSTPFDRGSADLLDELGVPFFKVGSGEVTNLPFLRYLARKGKPLMLSTGMSTMEEVAVAVAAITGEGNYELTLLHCVSSYPVPTEEANVLAMETMRKRFGMRVGYSDHTLGIEASLAAVALGASVIEKHFTLDRTMAGPDHQASLDVGGLARLVASVRQLEIALGSGEKVPMSCEIENMSAVRRSLFAAVEVPSGAVIREEMLTEKRPATGISPADMGRIVGRRALRGIACGEMLQWSMIRHDS